jgi:hypothetical protein
MGSVARFQSRPRPIQCAPRCVYGSIHLGGAASSQAQKRFTGTWIQAVHLATVGAGTPVAIDEVLRGKIWQCPCALGCIGQGLQIHQATTEFDR